MSFIGRARPHWEGAELPEWVMDGVLLIWPSQCDKSRQTLVLMRSFKSSTLPSLRRRVNFSREKLCCFPESPPPIPKALTRTSGPKQSSESLFHRVLSRCRAAHVHRVCFLQLYEVTLGHSRMNGLASL